MQASYHIKDDGEPGICRASVQDCPKESPHFKTMDEAYTHVEQINDARTFQSLSKKKKFEQPKIPIPYEGMHTEHEKQFQRLFKSAIPTDSALSNEAKFQNNMLNNARKEQRILNNHELSSHQKYVVQITKTLVQQGITTDKLYAKELSPGQVVYDAERDKQHQKIISEMRSKIDHIPCERKAIIAGGLGGSGKSSALHDSPDINSNEYYRIDPDEFKEELAKRGMIPKVPGTTPMEVSTIVHEESSYLSKRLEASLRNEGRNIIIDSTLASAKTSNAKVDNLRNDGYSVDGLFVDVTTETSKQRSNNRYVSGLQEYCLKGEEGNESLGGRYLPPDIIDQQKSDLPDVNSRNAENFVNLVGEGKLDNVTVFDNNGDGPREMPYEKLSKPVIHGRA